MFSLCSCDNNHGHFLHIPFVYLCQQHRFLILDAAHSSPFLPLFDASTVHFSNMFLSMDRCNVYCMLLCPGRFKLLSHRHGSTTEVGFIQVRVQNDASSTAHYNALILGGIYTRVDRKERNIEDRRDKNKDSANVNKERGKEEKKEHRTSKDKERNCQE